MLLQTLYQKLVSIPLRLVVTSKLLPEKPVEDLQIDLNLPIYYVLQRRSTSSFLMLKERARTLGWPEPTLVSGHPDKVPNGAVFFLQNKLLFGMGGKPVGKYQKLFATLVRQQKADLVTPIVLAEEKAENPVKHQLLPVSIYWGRNPGKENSLFRLFFTDTENTTPLRKFFLILFQGRNSFVRISKPIDMSQVVGSNASESTLVTKLTRTLRIHFHRNRQAAMGPLISQRKQVIRNVVVADNVRKAIEREASSKKISLEKARKQAEKYADEIASAYSYKTVRILESALTHLWNRIYDGVEVRNAEKVRELATSHEIVYLPCHRSHIDYLLLSYTLYHEGLVAPHIAAGINLNFWPAGPVLRRGGAFFLRRSFGGNKLYTAVFNEYIFTLMNKGIPLEFFPEGGRSRTGRLLPPRTGLLAMMLQACLRGTRKPVVIMPVYIGYERIFEGKSYLNELRGAAKQKESFGQLLGISKTLKQAFGKVYLNFAEPVFVNQYLDQHQPDWTSLRGQVNAKPGWLAPQVTDLAQTLMEKINASVTLNAVSLVSLILLSTERAAIARNELKSHLELLIDLVEKAPYSQTTYLPERDPDQLMAQAEKLGTIFKVNNPMGEIVATDEQTAILLTYYRNNILHVYMTSALIASCFINKESMTQTALLKDLLRLFPLLKHELFLHWDQEAFSQQVKQTIQVFIEKGLLVSKANSLYRAEESTEGFNLLFSHAQIAKPTLQRYGIILTLLSVQAGHTGINRKELETRSQQLSQRIAALYSLNAPESFDQNLFRNTVSVLRDNNLLKVNDNNCFSVTDELLQLQQLILDKVDVNAKHLMQKASEWAERFWQGQPVRVED